MVDWSAAMSDADWVSLWASELVYEIIAILTQICTNINYAG